MRKIAEDSNAMMREDIEAITSSINMLCSGQADKALESLLLRKHRYDSVPEYHYLLARAHAERNSIKEALENIQQLLIKRPYHSKAIKLFESLQAQIQSGQSTYNPHYERNVEQVNQLLHHALESINSGNAHQAYTNIITAKDLNIPVMNLHFVEAIYFLQTGKISEAMQALETETRLFPQNTSAHNVMQEIMNQLPG